MLLVIDVGNTNIVMGVYDDETLAASWRVHTEPNITEDEFSLIANGLFAAASIRPDVIRHTIISSVVPPMVSILDAFCKKYLNHAPHWVDARVSSGMPILYNNPNEVGADRIVNGVGAYETFRTALVVIDFGTATTFDVISEKGEYVGGAICPGINISAEALFQRASRLPRVELFTAPASVIGKDTISSIQSGLIFGYAGLVDGIVRRIIAEMGAPMKVVATGGLAPMMADISETIEIVDQHLTLEGLRIICKRIEER